jgi:predicted membrane protein
MSNPFVFLFTENTPIPIWFWIAGLLFAEVVYVVVGYILREDLRKGKESWFKVKALTLLFGFLFYYVFCMLLWVIFYLIECHKNFHQKYLNWFYCRLNQKWLKEIEDGMD